MTNEHNTYFHAESDEQMLFLLNEAIAHVKKKDSVIIEKHAKYFAEKYGYAIRQAEYEISELIFVECALRWKKKMEG